MIACFALCDEPEPSVLQPPPYVDSVHLTLLLPDGSGKAKVERSKIVVGKPEGRPIMIASPNDLLGLAITEGIEDALSVHAATGLGVWAAGSAPLMPSLADNVPTCVEAVTIVYDDDLNGRRHANALGDALRSRGIEVLFANPNRGR